MQAKMSLGARFASNYCRIDCVGDWLVRGRVGKSPYRSQLIMRPVGREFHDDFFITQPSLQWAFIEVRVSLDKTIH